MGYGNLPLVHYIFFWMGLASSVILTTISAHTHHDFTISCSSYAERNSEVMQFRFRWERNSEVGQGFFYFFRKDHTGSHSHPKEYVVNKGFAYTLTLSHERSFKYERWK